jgi:hypothetical protein
LIVVKEEFSNAFIRFSIFAEEWFIAEEATN